MRVAFLIAFMAVATNAFALDWPVLPNEAWDNDAGVNVEYVYTRGSATGPVIGAAAVLQGPLRIGEPRLVAASQFEGRGETVCLVANAVRGTERSDAVSNCHPFRLGPPRLSNPR